MLNSTENLNPNLILNRINPIVDIFTVGEYELPICYDYEAKYVIPLLEYYTSGSVSFKTMRDRKYEVVTEFLYVLADSIVRKINEDLDNLFLRHGGQGFFETILLAYRDNSYTLYASSNFIKRRTEYQLTFECGAIII